MSWRRISFDEMKSWHETGLFEDNPMLPAAYYKALTEDHVTTVVFTKSGKPVMLTGLFFHWQGMAENWCIVLDRDEMLLCARGVIADVLEMIDQCVKSFNLHRIQCIVDVGNEQNLRWARYFGFEQEGVMRKYTPDGRDVIRMARLF